MDLRVRLKRPHYSSGTPVCPITTISEVLGQTQASIRPVKIVGYVTEVNEYPVPESRKNRTKDTVGVYDRVVKLHGGEGPKIHNGQMSAGLNVTKWVDPVLESCHTFRVILVHVSTGVDETGRRFSSTQSLN